MDTRVSRFSVLDPIRRSLPLCVISFGSSDILSRLVLGHYFGATRKTHRGCDVRSDEREDLVFVKGQFPRECDACAFCRNSSLLDDKIQIRKKNRSDERELQSRGFVPVRGSGDNSAKSEVEVKS